MKMNTQGGACSGYWPATVRATETNVVNDLTQYVYDVV